MKCSHQSPLVKPDVRNYRIRLSDDPSAIGIRKELTAMISQVDKPLGLQSIILRRTAKLLTVPLAPRPQNATPFLLGLTAQFPAQLRNFQGQTGFRFDSFFRRGTLVQAAFPLLLKTRSKSCPLAPRGLAASRLSGRRRRPQASLRPPLKPDVQFSSIRLSQRLDDHRNAGKESERSDLPDPSRHITLGLAGFSNPYTSNV